MDYLKKFHDEDWHTPKGRIIREVVFGINDGLVTAIGFIAGVTVSMADVKMVLLSGLAEMVAGAISMFFGAYLSTKSQREFFDNEIKRETREIDEMPEKETKENHLYISHGNGNTCDKTNGSNKPVVYTKNNLSYNSSLRCMPVLIMEFFKVVHN